MEHACRTCQPREAKWSHPHGPIISCFRPPTLVRAVFFPQMQSWIDQAKTKLIDIIEQAKKDVSNLQLRVSFVG